jgi:hypothetical protein
MKLRSIIAVLILFMAGCSAAKPVRVCVPQAPLLSQTLRSSIDSTQKMIDAGQATPHLVYLYKDAVYKWEEWHNDMVLGCATPEQEAAAMNAVSAMNDEATKVVGSKPLTRER